MKSTFIKITAVLLFCSTTSMVIGQDEVTRPQLWSNLYVGWNINDKFALRSGAGFNVLFSTEAPWNEITLAASGVYKFHRFMEANAGLYVGATKQSSSLRSFEYRPYVGYRIFTNDTKRWYVSNLSRLEIRLFHYSDRTTELAFRFRNRTNLAVSILKPSMSDNRNLYLVGYFELFYNFEEEVRERFFNQFKYKLGLGYRFSYEWRFDIGAIYQDSRDNVTGPSQLPVTINTDWILEWGIVYIIPQKKND